MAGKSKKPGIKKLQINLTNRWLYTLIVFFSLVVIGVFVYAVAPNPGHEITEIAAPDACGTDQFLQWTGSVWTCGDAGAGSIGGSGTANYIPKFTGATTVGNSVIYENAGKVGIGTANPGKKLDVDGAGRFTGALTAATINTGNGAMEVNSIAAYLGNQNLRTTDSPTFDGATINGIFSLGTPTVKTISSGGAITMTRSFHILETYGGSDADTLTKINGGEVGMILILKTRSASRDVTLRERTTANQGNLYLSGTSFTLGTGVDTIVLIKGSEAYWTELSRSRNVG